jgi:hypothetical protein
MAPAATAHASLANAREGNEGMAGIESNTSPARLVR